MKKICIVATKDYNFYNFRRDFIVQLKEKGHDVVLICPYGRKIDFFTDRGCRFIDIKVDRRGKNPLNELSLLKGYIKIFKAEEPDLVLTYTTKCSIYAGIACRLLKLRYIVNNAGLVKETGITAIILNVLYKVGFKKADCLMYQNSQERDYLNKILHRSKGYRDLPGSGVDLREFQLAEYPKKEDSIVFNYVGRIVALKGINEFLDCAEYIKSKYANTLFEIYGEYDDVEYKERIKKLEKQGIVSYGGVLLDMKPAIQKSSAVIHASHYEGMTNVVLEHSAMGRVCIGADIPGIKEGIDDGVTGFLFEPENSNDLIKKVEMFIGLPYEKKVKFGLLARQKMVKEFDREIVTKIYFEEIEKVLQKQR